MLYIIILSILTSCAIVDKPCEKYTTITKITCVKKRCVIDYSDKSKFYLSEEYAKLLRIGDKSCE